MDKLKTIPLRERKNLYNIHNRIPLTDSKILSDNPHLEELADEMVKSRRAGKEVILLMGAHVIKTGLSDFIIDFIKKGVLTSIAMNGAGAIHDFEIAFIGETSEDVAQNIKDGSFGMANETGHYLNKAAKLGAIDGRGYGESIARIIKDLNLDYKDNSILYQALINNVPVSVFTAIGTEIIYQHPECDGAALGKSSYTDFLRFTQTVKNLEQGVVINLGSAVILPEVFLKSLSMARNLGNKVSNITTANIDMINHYRPRVNVVERPTSLGGKGLNIIEKHEKSVPTIHYYIKKSGYIN